MGIRSSFRAILAVTGLALTAAQGCNLIAGLEDVTFESGGSGGTGTGAGGTTGSTTSDTEQDGCDVTVDCQPASGECKIPMCDSGPICWEENAPDGTAAATQTGGDCKKNVCQGGAVVSDNDDDDPPGDGDDCTVDLCSAGEPVTEPASAGTPCTGPAAEKVCDGTGECVECAENADCTDPLKQVCDSHKCVPQDCANGSLDGSETDVDCGGSCNGCDTDQACSVDGDCFHGKCGADSKCAPPSCDDGVQNGGAYLGDDGETDVDCGGPCGATCGPMEGCDVNSDCVGDQCGGMGGTCVPNCQDQVLNGAETDVDCGGGTCAGCAFGKKCDSDVSCIATAYCDLAALPDPVCTKKKDNGATCKGDNQCATPFCVDGVCCNTSCGGTCLACDVAGNVGTCSYVPTGQDPANECMGAQVCNGAGQCRKPNGEACAGGIECLSATCVDDVCCNTACGGTCLACDLAGSMGTCTLVPAGQDPDNECAGALDCNGSGACFLDNGAPCANGLACQSGECVDGVCCDSACGSTCLACNLVGSVGMCTPVPAGADPDGECSGGTPDCNGNGGCGKGPGGATCVPSANNVCFGNTDCPSGGICSPVASGDPCFPGAVSACSDGGGGFVDCVWMGGACP
ncbi:MAG: hypothetical protein R3F14_01050 [Polyangiaceae bacterium]